MWQKKSARRAAKNNKEKSNRLADLGTKVISNTVEVHAALRDFASFALIRSPWIHAIT
jgi:hypothetical protein